MSKCRTCGAQALPGRRTCGNHKRRSAGRRTRFVHLDARIPELPTEDRSEQSPANKFPEIKQYNSQVSIAIYDSDLIAIVGLPTDRQNMIVFLGDWLSRGHSLAEIEALTPYEVVPNPQYANAYCSIANTLVRHDLIEVSNVEA